MEGGYYEGIRSVNENLRSLRTHKPPTVGGKRRTPIGPACRNPEAAVRLRRSGCVPLCSGCHDVFELWLDMNRLQAGSIPATAERLDEQDAANQALSLNDGRFLFIRKQDLLSTHNVEIADESSHITGCGDIQLSVCGIDGIGLRLAGGVEHFESGDIVLDFAKGVEHRCAIARDRCPVTGFGELDLRATRAARKDLLRDIGADRPKAAFRTQKLRQIRRVPAALAIQHQ